MKKVLSVLLAAAMTMGMSVASFAATYTWGTGSTATCSNIMANELGFTGEMLVVHNETIGQHATTNMDSAWDLVDCTTNNISASSNAAKVGTTFSTLLAGDVLYFGLTDSTCNHTHNTVCKYYAGVACDHTHYTGCNGLNDASKCNHDCTVPGTCSYEAPVACEHVCSDECVTDSSYNDVIDQHWSINIKAEDFVKSASFTTVNHAKVAIYGGTTTAKITDKVSEKAICVELDEDFNATSADTASFYMYVADTLTRAVSDNAVVNYSFNNITNTINTVSFNKTNDADVAATWKVSKGAKGTATFDFDDEAYFTVKMISEEKVVLNLDTAYDKAIDKEYNEYDADLEFYNFKGSKDSFTKVGELFIPADDDTFIYEIVDDELVAVEAEYVEDYKVANVGKMDGWMIETDELGYYVVADEELVVAEEEVVEAPVVEDNKANPETGANDFVGAAVALAVVSVAAAGALALKK